VSRKGCSLAVGRDKHWASIGQDSELSNDHWNPLTLQRIFILTGGIRIAALPFKTRSRTTVDTYVLSTRWFGVVRTLISIHKLVILPISQVRKRIITQPRAFRHPVLTRLSLMILSRRVLCIHRQVDELGWFAVGDSFFFFLLVEEE
jgi:hypothetical protein